MVDAIINFILNYKFVILFYLLIAIFVAIKWKKIDSQAKILLLYKTKFGINFIQKVVKKYREWVILVGYTGVGIGYIGIIFISGVLLKNLYDILFVAESTAGVSVVLPGVNVPGIGVLPFWYWLIALFFIALIHEFGHGVVAMAHKIKLDSTGIAFIGPIIGAFVEPNNKQMNKQSDIVKYSVMAAGPFFNFLLAIAAILLLKFAFFPLQEMMVEEDGFTFSEYVNESYPAAIAGLPTDTVITGIDGTETANFYEFAEVLTCKAPGDTITINSFDEEGNMKDYVLTLTANPDDENKGFMGINTIQNNVKVKEPYTHGIGEVAYYTLDWFNGMSNGGKGFWFWMYLLSLGIGLFNLLPLAITDGGQMLQLILERTHGKKKGNKRFAQVSMLFLIILLLNLVLPFAKNTLMSLI